MKLRKGGARGETENLRRGPSGTYWQARYQGTKCEDCSEEIEVGEEIMRADGGGYVHVECRNRPSLSERVGRYDGTDDKSMGF